MSFDEWFKAKYIEDGFVSSKRELEEAWNACKEEAAKKILDSMSSGERFELFHEYCVHCGDKDQPCQCWKDE